MTDYQVQTDDGARNVTADRYVINGGGDLLFFNGTAKDLPPVDAINRDRWRVVEEVGS